MKNAIITAVIAAIAAIGGYLIAGWPLVLLNLGIVAFVAAIIGEINQLKRKENSLGWMTLFLLGFCLAEAGRLGFETPMTPVIGSLYGFIAGIFVTWVAVRILR